MLGLAIFVLLLVLGITLVMIFAPTRHVAQRRLMNYDDQLITLRLLKRSRATLEEVLDPLLEPELADVRSLVGDIDEALEAYYKS